MTPQDVLANMDAVVACIEPAVKRSNGRYQTGDVIALVLQNTMRCWASVGENIEAVAITQFLNFPRVRVLSMPFVGGRNMDQWFGFMDEVIIWAKDQGCTQIETYDARGGAWQRKLGWDTHYLAIGKDI